MRALSLFIALITISACQPKPAGNDTDIDSGTNSSTTDGIDVMWAVGYWFRPGGGSPTEYLATIDVKPDHTAELFTEACGSDKKSMKTIGWKPLDADTIEFVSLDGSTPDFFSFTAPTSWTVTMSRTDNEKIVRVTDGKTGDHAYMGNYWHASKKACLVLREPHLGCADGAYVEFSCPDA